MFDVPTGMETIIGDHEKPIKAVVHNPVDSKFCHFVLFCVASAIACDLGSM
jgi:hypothetical protein